MTAAHNGLDSEGVSKKGDPHESSTQEPAPSRRPRGPGRFGQEAAAALGKDLRSDTAGPAMEEQELLKFAEKTGSLISEQIWLSHRLVSGHTAEHEVRFRIADRRALKRTWPGTFGYIPRLIAGKWEPTPALPSEYLTRLALQNELFADSIELEGFMISSGPSMIIGAPSGGLSLVVSQTWLEAADNANQFPSEQQIRTLMEAKGFRLLFGSLFGWQNEPEQLVILDAKPDNFIATPAGILPVDLLIAECLTNNRYRHDH
jgi:hypothetical protein